MRTSRRKGFSLIELMVTISIVTLLSSILAVALSSSKAKANDVKKITEAKSVETALSLYHLQYQTMPPMYDCTNNPCVESNRLTLGPEKEDTANPNNPNEAGRAYNRTMQEMVNKGVLAAIPRSPDGRAYSYFNYGPGNSSGVVFSTSLVMTDAPPSSCTISGSTNYSCQAWNDTPGYMETTDPGVYASRETVTLCLYQDPYEGCHFAYYPDGTMYSYTSSVGGENGEQACPALPPVFPGTSQYAVCSPY